MANHGKLLGIAVREKSRAAMSEHDAIEISCEAGLAGDFRGKPGNRQVTVMTQESWEKACQVVGVELPWITRRANLLVSGVELWNTAGKTIQIGELVLQITGETDPCGRMNEYQPLLMQALIPEWRGGACCKVVHGSTVRIGDEVILADPS